MKQEKVAQESSQQDVLISRIRSTMYLVFPGVFRGAFDVRASDINEEMKIAAAKAIAELISDEELSEDNIIPKAFDKRVGPAVAKAVAEAARKTGVARK